MGRRIRLSLAKSFDQLRKSESQGEEDRVSSVSFDNERVRHRPGLKHRVVTGCSTNYACRMTMLSFRVDERDADEAQKWAETLGIDRSELLREALRRHLNKLASEGDADRWASTPLDEGEQALHKIADWGPAEDWSDWAVDAAR